MKYGTLRWFEHMMRINEDNFLKRPNKSRTMVKGVKKKPSVIRVNKLDKPEWLSIKERRLARRE